MYDSDAVLPLDACPHAVVPHAWAKGPVEAHLRGVTCVQGIAFGVPVVPEENSTFDTVSGVTTVALKVRTAAGSCRAGAMNASQVVSEAARGTGPEPSPGMTTAGARWPLMDATLAYSGTFLPAQSR